MNLINGELEKAETQNQIAGESFYNALIERENMRLESLAAEYAEKLAALNEAVSSGAVEAGSEAWHRMKEDVDGVTEAVQDSENRILEYGQSIKKIASLKFGRLEEAFGNAVSLVSSAAGKIEKQVSIAEEAGRIAGGEFYAALIDAEAGKAEVLAEKHAALLRTLEEAAADGSVEMYSERWYEMAEGISSTEEALLDSREALIKYSNAMRELDWAVFDRMQDSIGALAEESDFVISLLEGGGGLHHENGSLTDAGLAVQGLHAVNYDIYTGQAAEYGGALAEAARELAEDPGNMKLQDRYRKLAELQREAVLNAEAEKEAVRALASEGYGMLLSAVDGLASARKKELDAGRSLRSYGKSVADQSAEVDRYQKLLAAYSGDDSEEMKAAIQKAQQSLAEAQEELAETEYDRYISDQEAMLDSFRDQAQEWVDTRLDDINGLMQKAVDATNSNSEAVRSVIDSSLAAVGVSMSDGFSSILGIDYSGGVKDIVSGFFGDGDGSFSSAASGTAKAMEDIKKHVGDIKASTDSVGGILEKQIPELAGKLPSLGDTNSRIEDVKSAVDQVKDAVKGIDIALAGLNAAPPQQEAVGEPEGTPDTSGTPEPAYGHTETVTVEVSKPKAPASGAPQGGKGGTQSTPDTITVIKKDEIKKGGGGGNRYEAVNGAAADLHRYKSGARCLGRDEIAVTQEDGTEAILRPFEGIITPLQKNDTILDSEQTKRLYDITKMSPGELKEFFFGKGPADMRPKNRQPMPPAPAPAAVNSETEVNVTFSLPNVKTTDELYKAMQSEPRFEKLITGMAADRMLGRSSYRKFTL